MEYQIPYPFNPAYGYFNYADRDIRFDLMQHFSTDSIGTSPLFVVESEATTYTPLGDIASVGHQLSIPNYSNDTSVYYNQYDANGLMTASVQLDNINGAFDSARKFVFLYNTQGLRTLDTSYQYTQGAWEPYLAYQYTYNANGRIDSMTELIRTGPGMVTNQIFINEFYPNNFLKQVTTYWAMSGNAVGKDSFEYAGSSPYYTQCTRSYHDGSSWVPNIVIRKMMNAQNLPDSMSISTV